MSSIVEKIKENEKLYKFLVGIARKYEHFKNDIFARAVWAVCVHFPIQKKKVYLTNFNKRVVKQKQWISAGVAAAKS